MASKRMIEKCKRTPKYTVRGYNRCKRMALAGEIPGITKSSW